MDDAFGNWLAGFIDGEGYFGIFTNDGRYICAFAVGLHPCERPVLDDVLERTGLGTIHTQARMVRWQIRARGDCVGLIELLDRYPLRSRKAADYALWREAVLSREAGAPQGDLADLASALRSGRPRRGPVPA